jgi:hypothetical protein
MYELIYHAGFTGRSAPIQLLLLDAGVEYTLRTPTWSPDRVIQDSPGLPVFAPPVLIHEDFVLAQTTAIMLYLGKLHGYEVCIHFICLISNIFLSMYVNSDYITASLIKGERLMYTITM